MLSKFVLSFLVLILTACSTGGTVVIDAPIEQVWDYLSDNSKAREWSVYFHHITSLPGPPDSQIGAKRRCFRMEDETGMYWDEDLVESQKPHYRQIRTYNIHGYKDQALNEPEYKVEQFYEAISATQTKLTFKATVAKGFRLGSIYYAIRDYSDGKEIFKLNLENIKARVEGRPQPHPYQEHTRWD